MSDPADRYCSDCAWPYECADARSCHRRDMGEVRGEDLAPRPSSVEFKASAEEASRRAAYWRREGGVPSGQVMVTMTNPGSSGAFMEEARRRYEVGEGVASVKTDDGWAVLGKVHGPRQDVAQIPVPRGTVEFTATLTAEGLDALRDWRRRTKEAMAEALRVSADQLIAEARRPHSDAVVAYLFGALVPSRSHIRKAWLFAGPVSRRQLALFYWMRKLTEIDRPLLIGFDLAEAQS